MNTGHRIVARAVTGHDRDVSRLSPPKPTCLIRIPVGGRRKIVTALLEVALTHIPAGGYLLDNQAPDAQQRFAALSAIFDHVTARHVATVGLASGWSCWEVGAGGPALPTLLAERIGPNGRVLATDLDVTWLGAALPAPIEVRQHDVARDEPPGDGFDLVHARLVLSHVPERAKALRRMVRALRPGGWLIVEDFDSAMQELACVDPVSAEEELANRVRAEFLKLLRQRGVDLEYGRKLPRLLREAGLTEVSADAFFPVSLPAAAALEVANVQQVRDALLAGGRLTANDLDEHLAAANSGRADASLPPLIGAWGRRPE